MEWDINNAGAAFIDQEVVEDGNLIPGRTPADLPPFIRTCLKKLTKVNVLLTGETCTFRNPVRETGAW